LTWLRIAEATGRTVAEAQKTVDSAEYSQWLRYFEHLEAERHEQAGKRRCPLLG
jgi:hypothetical protein